MMTSRRAIAAVAIAAALAATGAGPSVAKETLSGAYLAGKHAAVMADVESAAEYFARALDHDPGNLILMEQALIYLTASGDVDAALLVAERLADFQPDHRMANLLLAAQSLKNGDLEATRARTEDRAEAFHPLVGAMLAAWAAHGLGDEAAAKAKLDGMGDRPVFRIFAGYHNGLMRHAAGDVKGAVAAYAKAAEEVETPVGRIARAYAAALRDDGQDDKAREVYEAAMSVAIGDTVLEADIEAMEAGAPATLLVKTPAEGGAEALYGLAAALGRDGEERLSLFYTRLATYLRPGFDEATLLAAELLEESGRNALAIRAFDAIPPGSPLSRAAEIGRAEALSRMGEDDRAAEALKSLTRRAPEAVEAHIALGDQLRRTERFREGAAAYDAAIKLTEAAGRPNWVLYYQRGICYERSDQFEKAEADLLKALEMQPDQPLVLNYLGYSWLEMGRNLDRAMEMIRKAVAARPEDGYIVDSLGWGYYLLEDFPNAVKELERAVEFQPVDPVINDHFGDALWRVGRKLEAAFQWRRALSFEPEKDDAQRIKRKLDVGLDVVLREEAEDAAASGDAGAAKANDG